MRKSRDSTVCPTFKNGEISLTRRELLTGLIGTGIWLPSSSTKAIGLSDPMKFEHVIPDGLDFVTHCSRTERRHQPETMVSGVGLIDYNNDGLLDIYVVNGATMPGLKKDHSVYYNRLFRNRGDGTFQDVTLQAGVQGQGYDMGVAIGDYDNDGFEDIFVAGVRGNTLYHNNGDGTFTDVTLRAGLDRPDPEFGHMWAMGAAWVDYDRDGWLDLFVSNYCVWDPAKEPTCRLDDKPDYCYPGLYKGLPNSLFHNNGDGTFTDVSLASGIRSSIGKGMGVAVADFDGDGWPDIFVTDDTTPNRLFRNQHDGRFEETSLYSGVAYTQNGVTVSGMGADARDIDNDGKLDIFVTALRGESWLLFRNLGNSLFMDVTYESGLTALSLPKSGWGNGIFDFNNDGWKDLFAACGGLEDPAGSSYSHVLQANTVLANLRNGQFADVSLQAGVSNRKAVHRGAAFGDLDNDGRIDVVVTALEGPLEVWRNVSPTHNHWLLIKTIGTKSNKSGIGAKLEVVTADGIQHNSVTTSVGLGSSSDRRVHFGLGKQAVVDELHISWPSGAQQTLRNIRADQILTILEP
jgi:hypothetical protein